MNPFSPQELKRVLIRAGSLSVFLTFSLPLIAEEILLEIGPHRDVDIKAVAEGVSDITISGGAPHFWTTPVAGAFDPGKHSVVSFEYFSTAGLESVSLRYRRVTERLLLADRHHFQRPRPGSPFQSTLAESHLFRQRATRKCVFILPSTDVPEHPCRLGTSKCGNLMWRN